MLTKCTMAVVWLTWVGWLNNARIISAERPRFLVNQPSTWYHQCNALSDQHPRGNNGGGQIFVVRCFLLFALGPNSSSTISACSARVILERLSIGWTTELSQIYTFSAELPLTWYVPKPLSPCRSTENFWMASGRAKLSSSPSSW